MNIKLVWPTKSFKQVVQYTISKYRDRMQSCFMSPEDAEKSMKLVQQKESSGKKKVKKHHGSFERYDIDKEAFLQEITTTESSIVNWAGLARKYKLTCKGKRPGNGGQVLRCFAKYKGVDVDKFNQHLRISGRDYTRRIRRPKKRIFKSKISYPTSRPGKCLNAILKDKVAKKEIYIGEKIVPKDLVDNKINDDGNLIENTNRVFGRKIPLKYIIQEETERLHKEGVLRLTTDNEYQTLEKEEILNRLENLGISTNSMNQIEALDKLKQTERTRHLRMWHGHSSILNHTFVNFMTSFLYDPANFLPDEEFKTNFPERKPVSVQSVVERPNLYIFGQSGSYS